MIALRMRLEMILVYENVIVEVLKIDVCLAILYASYIFDTSKLYSLQTTHCFTVLPKCQVLLFCVHLPIQLTLDFPSNTTEQVEIF